MRQTLVFAVVCSAALAGIVSAAPIQYSVTLDTTPLIGHAAGPFSLFLQLSDGSGTGDGNNTVTLSNFLFGGGSAAGSPVLSPGATGSLASGVTLVDTAPLLVTFDEGFTPGTALTFVLSLTNSVDAGPTPDQFSLSMLDSLGSALPTASLGSLGVDVFLTVDFDSSSPTVRTFASDPFRFPSAGDAIDIDAPSIAAIPEPSTIFMVFAVLLVLAGRMAIVCRREKVSVVATDR